MTRFLPILISLFVIRYSLFVSPSFAQEITPTITSASQLAPQASAWEDFLKNLIPAQFKQIPDTLENINRARLPLEVGESISNKTNTSINPQAASDGKQDIVAKAAGQYTIASGGQTPLQVSQASTNIFLDFFALLANAFGSIFGKGEKEAKNFAGTVAPADVTEQNFAQGIENITGMAVSNDTNVLGAQTGQAAMEKSLPFVQCSELPFGLCSSDNKPNFVK